jgi:hypothetical protein
MKSRESHFSYGAPFRFALLSVFALLASLLLAGQAPAATVTDRPLLFSIDGSDSSPGSILAVNHIAVDNLSGDVYVAEQKRDDNENPHSQTVICKFNPDGTAADFTATGTSCITGSPGHPFAFIGAVAVDNSGGPTQGRIYVSSRSPNSVQAFTPSGDPIWPSPIVPALELSDIAVDSAGHPWTVAIDNSKSGISRVTEYANTGSPPAPIGLFETGQAYAIDLDTDGNVYVSVHGVDVEKFVGGISDSVLDLNSASDLYVDQSSANGHIFTLHSESFNEYEASGALVGTFGGNGAIDSSEGIESGEGIAYDKGLDRVYVGDRGQHVVRVLGPPATGTVPDATLEAPDEVGVGKATFHGTVNPQGVANAYYFEWATDPQKRWRNVERSPEQSLPEDSSPHAVSFTSLNLRGNSNYQVRLVAINAANGLRSASNVDEFKTAAQTHLPEVTIDPVAAGPTAPCTTGITAQSACVSGAINPWEETTSWRVQRSTDPECKTGFADEPVQTLLAEGRVTPVPVHVNLEGLLPAQHYCVRISATNSLGTVVSSVEQFTTKAIPPSEASTAFTAPRAETTARINARVNPEGEAPLTYRFEWSKDGGVTWIALPERISTLAAREQVVVAAELTGLQPGITYQYRLALAKNDAGQAVIPGEAKSFTTRTAAEVTLPLNTFGAPRRGLELVSNPDKGNQNFFASGPGLRTSPIAANGEKVYWQVAGGAPGAPNGTQATFLAERSPQGWRSHSVPPQAQEQLGGGEFAYVFLAATPDFEATIFSAGMSSATASPPPPDLLRIRDSGMQEPLKKYSYQPQNKIYEDTLDLSDDGKHVLFLDGTTGQLEDIGKPGEPEVVSLMPGGSPSSCGMNIEQGRSFVGGPQHRPGYHWIATTNASRVYFRAPADGQCSGPYGLYVRNREAAQTSLIDAGAAGHEPQMIRATPDGHHAYFVTDSKLDPADDNESGDIYRWDEETGQSSCLTCVADPEIASEASQVLVSDDFSHIYFTSKRRLVSGQGTPGDTSIYVLSGGTIRFVADVGVLGGPVTSELSTDGNVLLFRARAKPSLTADSIAPKCLEPSPSGDEVVGECNELYRYDDRDGSTECLSCRQDGLTTHSFGTPTGNIDTDFRLSGDGSTVAFATQEGLVRLDVNRNTDIYEWRNGSVGLLTDGVSTFQTNLAAPEVLGVDGDGSDILFGLVPPAGTLTGFEQDQLLNLYDARIGGGFVPPSPPEHCTEDSCQGPLQAPPASQQPASGSFSGKGNARPGSPASRCGKNRVRRKGRCVKRHRSKHRRHGRTTNTNQGRAK